MMASPARLDRRRLLVAVLAIATAPCACERRPAPLAGGPADVPRPIGAASALELFPALSPDGETLASSVMTDGKLEIHVRPLAGGPAKPLTRDGRNNVQPAWSPDGRLIAYHSKDRGGIWRVPASGGPARLIASFGARPAFSPDGRRVAFQTMPLADVAATAPPGFPPSTIWVVDAGGGAAIAVTKAGNPIGGHGAPAWSPDGQRIVFVTSEPRLLKTEIWSVRPDGSELTRVHAGSRVFGGSIPSPDGRFLWFGAAIAGGGHALLRLPLDGERRGATGPPEQMTLTGPSVSREPTFSADGKRLAWSELTTTASIWSLPLDPATALPSGPSVPLTAGDGRASWPVFSPDGSTIAFQWIPSGGNSDVWLMDADGANQRPVSDGPAIEQANDFFPDGKRLLCFSNREEGNFAAYELELETRRFRKIPLDLAHALALRLSPDGTKIAFHSKRDSVTVNTWIADLPKRTQKQLTFDREFVGYPCWSPDGRELAFEVRRGDDVLVGVVPSAGGTPELVIEKRGLSWPFSYSPDGRYVAFAGYRDDTWNVWLLERATRQERRLTQNRRLDVYMRYPSWSPRGDRIVYEQAETRGEIFLLDVGAAAR